jgi:hypothetical protein
LLEIRPEYSLPLFITCEAPRSFKNSITVPF